MNTDRRHPHPEEDEETLGVLDAPATIDAAGIGLLGDATAQVTVSLPPRDEDDDLVDDDVVEGEAHEPLVLDADPAASVPMDDGIGRIHDGGDIVIELPADLVVVAELVEDPAEEDPAEVEDPAEESVERDTADDAEEAFVETVAHSPVEADEVASEDVIVVPSAPTTRPEDAARMSGLAEDVPGSGAVEGDQAAPAAEAEAEAQIVDEDDTTPPAPMPVIALRDPAPAATGTVQLTASVPIEEDPVTEDAIPAVESALASRRLDQFGDRDRESADLLTADRLLDPHQLTRPEPEGLWSHLLYTVSGRRINLGDGRRAKERKALDARIAAPLPGSARFVPVLSRKGGVGKTAVTALLGMALADAREDRVIAVDANPDRGTLADRIARTNGKTVRDLVRIHDRVTGYHDISAVVSRDGTRLDVLASDTDPHVSEAFNDEDYERVASVAARYYSLVLTDTGTGIVHAVMGATLDHADTLVLVAGLSVDEARLASETLTWLEANGYADKVRRAVVVLNQSSPGAPMVRLDELEAHFRTRVAHVLRIPYDAQIAAGSAITYSALQPETRHAARELAAIVVEGLRERAA
ncbi:MinD/ParA family protein [uncultured Microbacterium sp.]|uniref:MinD/ParA family ATP-binding protein n=1 Tax=uncultured Microbacterium sp. TaxID=191216 RepID=UPI0025D6AF83|nr:MinD/ParA family protein [uncultured Microbacterium sp.]